MGHFDYTTQTLKKYQDSDVAKRYKEAYTNGMSYIRMSNLKVKKIIQRSLSLCNLRKGSLVLDIPCGTGVLAHELLGSNLCVTAADISKEMMDLAAEDYNSENFCGFVQADATNIPYENNHFDLIVNVGLIHRVPIDVKRKILREVARTTKEFVILSCSLTNTLQKIKTSLLSKVKKNYLPSPCPITFKALQAEIEEAGLEIMKTYKIFPLVSSHIVLLLKKIQ